MEIICDFFMKKKFTNKEISSKKKKIYQVLKDIFKNDLNLKKLNKGQIKDLFILYDHVFLFDNFYNYLTENSINIKFEISYENLDKLGDTRIINSNLHQITIYQYGVNQLIHNDYTRIGGIKCYDQIQCLMHIFEHELIHAIIHVFCKEKEENGHGYVFQTILKNIFGHTQIHYVNLSKKLNMTHTEIDKKVNNLKKLIKIGDIVESYQIDNKVKKGGVKEIHQNYVILENLKKLYFEYINKIIK